MCITGCNHCLIVSDAGSYVCRMRKVVGKSAWKDMSQEFESASEETDRKDVEINVIWKERRE